MPTNFVAKEVGGFATTGVAKQVDAYSGKVQLSFFRVQIKGESKNKVVDFQ